MQQTINHLRLRLRNIASLRAFTVDLTSGTITELSGRNGSGKSTALNGLRYTMSGKACKVPDYLVTEMEDAGDIETTVDDQLTIKRHLQTGNTATELTLLGENGLPMQRPAEALKSLFGDGQYLNPITIVEMSTSERTKAITAALPLDPALTSRLLEDITGTPWDIKYASDIFPAIKEAYEGLYEARKRKHGEADDAEAQSLGVLSYLPDEFKQAKDDGQEIPKPRQPADLGDIHTKKAQADTRNAERKQLAEQLGSQEQYLRTAQNTLDGDAITITNLSGELSLLGEPEDPTAIEEEIRRLQEKLEDLKWRNFHRKAKAGQLATLQAQHAEGQRRQDDLQARFAILQARSAQLGGEEDITALQAKIDRYSDDMEIWQRAIQEHGETELRWEQSEDLKSKAAALTLEWRALDAKVKAVNDLPLQLLENVPLPIPGMVISGDKIFLPQGDTLKQFEQFGEGDKLRFAAQLAMALCPVNLLLIDGVEKLDPDNRIVLYKAVAEAGFLALTTLAARGDLTVNQFSYNDLSKAGEA